MLTQQKRRRFGSPPNDSYKVRSSSDRNVASLANILPGYVSLRNSPNKDRKQTRPSSKWMADSNSLPRPRVSMVKNGTKMTSHEHTGHHFFCPAKVPPFTIISEVVSLSVTSRLFLTCIVISSRDPLYSEDQCVTARPVPRSILIPNLNIAACDGGFRSFGSQKEGLRTERGGVRCRG